MDVILDFSEEEILIIEKCAKIHNLTAEEFVTQTIKKFLEELKEKNLNQGL